jgi:hypothetical protein
MKKILFSMAAVLMLMTMFTSCSDDKDEEVFKFEEQTYSAWSKVAFAYGSMYDAEETIKVSQKQLSFHSDTWGDGSFVITDFKYDNDGNYYLTGEGTLTMAGHGSNKDYAATLTGTISKNTQTFTITIPSVMGGTVLNIVAGDIPLAAAIDGSYTGGTYANCKYFQHYQPTKDEKVTIKANNDLTAASLSYTSATWGEFTFDNITVSKNENGSYVLKGEGKTIMSNMKGGTNEYVSTFEGSITNKTLVATFAVPSVMGGTTVYFNASDFDEIFEASNTNAEGGETQK